MLPSLFSSINSKGARRSKKNETYICNQCFFSFDWPVTKELKAFLLLFLNNKKFLADT
jgi:hypothetical protein